MTALEKTPAAYGATPVEPLPRSGDIRPFSQAFNYTIQVHRIWQKRFGFPGMAPGNAAFVSLTEYDFNTGNPFIGVASMKVYNVAPGDGFVDVRGEIDDDNDLNIRVSIFQA
jgi:hypothetical protein